MKRSVLAIVVLGVAAAAGLSIAVLGPRLAAIMTPRTAARDQALEAGIWEDLRPYQDNYLTAYREALQSPPDDPVLLVTAFNELAYAVTGRGGIWRRMVPDQFFGCIEGPENPICVRLRDLEGEFERWDALQESLSAIASDRDAVRVLKENGARMRDYTRTMVPANRSLSAVEATPFFVQNLSRFLEGTPSAAE